MKITTQQIYPNWHIATGKTEAGRSLWGAGRTASEALQEAIKENGKYNVFNLGYRRQFNTSFNPLCAGKNS